MKQFHRRLSTKVPSNNLRYILGTGLALTSVGLGYILFNSPSKQTPGRPLPAVDKLMPMSDTKEQIYKNEVFKLGVGVRRMDFNSLGSNTPCEDYHSEHEQGDSLIVGVYDGHGGPQCGDFVSKTLPSYIAQKVEGLKEPNDIKKAIKDAFVQFDQDLLYGRITPTPVSTNWYSLFSTPDFKSIFQNLKTAVSGSCALVALLKGNDLYVASIGDCRAVLGRAIQEKIETVELSQDQTGRSPTEYSRLCEEHPGEENTVVIRGRVLGGDARYKWSRDIQNVVIPFVYPDNKRGIPRNLLTPPYVTAEPEVVRYERDNNDKFLIMACDGLWDDMSSKNAVQVVWKWIKEKYTGNYATGLIKAALSGFEEGGPVEDWPRIQHHLSIPSPKCRRWRDDMTINVLFFDDEVEEKGGKVDAIPPFMPGSSPQLDNWIKQIQRKSKL